MSTQEHDEKRYSLRDILDAVGQKVGLAPEDIDSRLPTGSSIYGAVRKTDAKLQIAYGEVYVPGVPDTQGDFMTAEEIRKMAHEFLGRGETRMIDIEHNGHLVKAAIVESFIAREDDNIYIPNSWVVGMHVESAEVWKAIEDGELNGFSMQAVGMQEPKKTFIDMPSMLQGFTEPDPDDGHHHGYTIRFDEFGNMLGGTTEGTFPEDHPDHDHAIKRPTITEPGGPGDTHIHRWSFVEHIEVF